MAKKPAKQKIIPGGQPAMVREEVEHIVSSIQLPDERKIRVGKMGHGFFIQIVYRDIDVDTAKMADQFARKWYVSAFSTTTEVVRTVYKAALTSYEHYLGEHFLYEGERVMSPHFSIRSLQALAHHRQFDGRIPKQPRKRA